MLLCPRCESENPQKHKFCQNCGVSLTEKTCCECQANIPIEAKICNFCGADNHTILWAIISQKQPELEQVIGNYDDSGEKLEIESLSDLFAEGKSAAKSLLQLQQEDGFNLNRYTVQEDTGLDRLSVQNVKSSQGLIAYSDCNLLQKKVIDQYPLQKSHLATLQKQQMDLFAELSQDLNNSYLAVAQYWNLVGLPTHALPYLILEKYTPIIPRIYDAWQEQDRGIVLLPDRSSWQRLTDLWSSQKMPMLQIIWFLDEMAKLWQPLQRISCAQSLLINDNLRIDEDQAFCLQQLYMDEEDAPTLKDLVQVWQLCFAESNIQHLDELHRLLERVMAGEINEIEELRLELHNLGLDEDEVESFDIHTNYIDANMTQSQPDQIKDTKEFAPTQEPVFFDDQEGMVYGNDFEEQATAIIPMQLRGISDACCTDIGSQRDHNEDFFGIRTNTVRTENNTDDNLAVHGLYIVCDGMGGHAAGEVASAMAVETLQKYFKTHWQHEFPEQETIEAGILQANKALYQINIENSRSGSGRMGTTLVMAMLQDTQLAIAHVGDSRIYRLTRKQGLEQLTLDHEVGQREINRGVEPDIAYGRPDAYQLTQALGPRDNNYVRPEIQFMDITEDCILLLCSDGLSDNDLLENNWQEYLEPLLSSGSDLQDGLFKLVSFANEYNGHDNITAVSIRVKLKPDF